MLISQRVILTNHHPISSNPIEIPQKQKPQEIPRKSLGKSLKIGPFLIWVQMQARCGPPSLQWPGHTQATWHGTAWDLHRDFCWISILDIQLCQLCLVGFLWFMDVYGSFFLILWFMEVYGLQQIYESYSIFLGFLWQIVLYFLQLQFMGQW